VSNCTACAGWDAYDPLVLRSWIEVFTCRFWTELFVCPNCGGKKNVCEYLILDPETECPICVTCFEEKHIPKEVLTVMRKREYDRKNIGRKHKPGKK
jgi:hypothetical protein